MAQFQRRFQPRFLYCFTQKFLNISFYHVEAYVFQTIALDKTEIKHRRIINYFTRKAQASVLVNEM